MRYPIFPRTRQGKETLRNHAGETELRAPTLANFGSSA
jgi:hypothetical protein